MLDLHFGCQPCIKVLFIIFVQIQLITLLHSLYISSHHSHTSHWSKFLSKLIFAFFLSCPINTYGSTNALYYTPFIVSETLTPTPLSCPINTRTLTPTLSVLPSHSSLSSLRFKLSKSFPWPPKENWTDLPQDLKKVKHQDH